MLELREKVLGSEYPATLTSINNLTLVLWDQGKYEAVEEMHWWILELREKVLGLEYLAMLMSIDNLTLVLRDQGKYEEVEQMY